MGVDDRWEKAIGRISLGCRTRANESPAWRTAMSTARRRRLLDARPPAGRSCCPDARERVRWSREPTLPHEGRTPPYSAARIPLP